MKNKKTKLKNLHSSSRLAANRTKKKQKKKKKLNTQNLQTGVDFNSIYLFSLGQGPHWYYEKE